MSNAFAPIVRARPNPIFGRPVHQGSPPFDYSPILLLKPFGFRIAPDTLSSGIRRATGSRSVLAVSGFRLRARLESVRRDHAGLHSFLSMSLIEARRRNASAFRLRFSQSLARRLHRPSHANVRSTTHRFGRTTNPFA